MKIAIVDMYYEYGHKGLNTSLVKILNSFSDIILLDYQEYYKNISSSEKLSKIQLRRIFPIMGNRISRLIRNCLNLSIICRMLFRKEYDAILIVTYDNISLSIMWTLLKRKPIYIIHHNNIDGFRDKAENFFFKRYMNHVNHIVFAEFIKEGLISKMNVNRDRVFVLDHPLVKMLTIDVGNDCINKETTNKIFVSLGLGSDENLIQQLIEIDKENGYFENNCMKLILRSRLNNYESKGLKVFTGILPEDEYYKLYKMSSAYLLLYPETFQNRFSGSILNALQCGKCVISTDIPIARYFSTYYPNNCRIITNIENLLTELTDFNLRFNYKEYEELLRRHDDSTIRKQAMHIFVSNC